MPEPDVSVVINAHSEGMLAHPTVRSVQMAAAHARASGLTVEIIAVEDRPSPETAEYFDECMATGFTRLTVSLGDPGLARNAGVQAARGTWLAFVDADDLWSPNWLSEAHACAVRDTRPVVWHPEANQYFGIAPHIFAHVDMEDPAFDLLVLSSANYWTSASFSRREFYAARPFPASDLDGQLGYEDWTWNLEAIRTGGLHKIVPGTVHCIRQKPISVVMRTTAKLSLMCRSGLMRDVLENPAKYRRFLPGSGVELRPSLANRR